MNDFFIMAVVVGVGLGWFLGFKSGRARALRRPGLMVTVKWKAELAGRTLGGRTWSRAASQWIAELG